LIVFYQFCSPLSGDSGERGKIFEIKVGKKEKEGETENGSPSCQTTARLVGRGGGWQGGTVQSPMLESEYWRVEVLTSEFVPSPRLPNFLVD